MSKVVIFDLDGTLANIDHRKHLVEGAKKDWDGFFRECVHDTVVEPVKQALLAHEVYGHEIWIWSGRSEAVLEQTHQWILENGLYADKVLMRKEGDYTPDDELKQKWMRKSVRKSDIVMVYDDRNKVVDMWRSEGIVCCQVAPGDF